MRIVELRKASVVIGGVTILDAVDLEIEGGERVGVVGPNGAGKSTLLGLIATLVLPSHGAGEVLGASLTTRDRVRDVRRSIGWSGHDPALYAELTLGENLRHVAALSGLDRRAGDEALELVGLAGAADRRADRCSNGMRRRADLARLLLNPPRVALLDEPLSGLDQAATVIVEEIVARAVAREGAAILVSHDPGLLGGQVDRLVSLHDGRVVE